ncbi:MAG: HAD family phosphatase [Planctomycetaceae bacterium]|nr:HAD family phosphatase [Planctomycetaceae bacterium]
MFTVLWDNDGVLVDTEGLYFQATKTVLQTVDVGLTPEQFKEISLRRGESTFVLAEERGIDPNRIARLRAERDRIYAESLGAESRVMDGVAQVLRSLHGRVRMAVVTSTRREHFEIIHDRSGLLPYFDFVLTREDCEHTKPHPEPYLKALARAGNEPDECVVIEDSERGLASAKAAGLECLIVLSDWTRDGNFSQASKVLQNISQVPDEVLRLASDRQESWERRPR